MPVIVLYPVQIKSDVLDLFLLMGSVHTGGGGGGGIPLETPLDLFLIKMLCVILLSPLHLQENAYVFYPDWTTEFLYSEVHIFLLIVNLHQ